MREVQISPQLTSSSLSPRKVPRRISDFGQRSPKFCVHAPCLPRRDGFSVKTRAALLNFVADFDNVVHQLDGVTRDIENEVMLESETSSVNVAAAFCFAEFGSPPSYDAPGLTTPSNTDLTEDELDLAACLATPFEGNPQAEGARVFPNLATYLATDEAVVSTELERKHLRALLIHRRRTRALSTMAARYGRFKAALLHIAHSFARDMASDLLYRGQSEC